MSSRAYTRVYSSTYTGKFGTGSIVVPGGDFTVVQVPFPPSGRVTELVVVQTGGSSAAFTVDLLNSSTPYLAGSYPNGTPAASPIDLYRIIAQQSATAGNPAAFRQDNGQIYRNIDGDLTNVQRYVYLIISPTGAGSSTTWDASLTVREEEL